MLSIVYKSTILVSIKVADNGLFINIYIFLLASDFLQESSTKFLASQGIDWRAVKALTKVRLLSSTVQTHLLFLPYDLGLF